MESEKTGAKNLRVGRHMNNTDYNNNKTNIIGNYRIDSTGPKGDWRRGPQMVGVHPGQSSPDRVVV